jgi:hypothetical protein
VNARDLVSVFKENECDWSKFGGSSYLIVATGTTKVSLANAWRNLDARKQSEEKVREFIETRAAEIERHR